MSLIEERIRSGRLEPPTNSAAALTQGPIDSAATRALDTESKSKYIQYTQHEKLVKFRRQLGVGLLVLAVIAGGVASLLIKGHQDGGVKAGNFANTHVSLGDVPGSGAASPGSLNINGQLKVSGPLQLAPSGRPEAPKAGQLYYDQTSNQLSYYNGTTFINTGGGGGASTSVQNITNNITNGTPSVINNIFNSSSGNVVVPNGPPGSIAMFDGPGKLSGSSLSQNGTTVSIASDAGSAITDINVGGGVAQRITLGSALGTSSTTVQGGVGDLKLITGPGAASSGSIILQSGDTQAGVSGNVTIDTGSGIISGTEIEHKSFEDGLDDMQAWFGNVVSQSTAQAHDGIYSLAETGTGIFWGVIEALPGVSLTAGHRYVFTAWVRAESTPRTINGLVNFVGSGGSLPFNTVIDSATGWTQMTASGVAPAGATSAYYSFQGIDAVGETHYFDDIRAIDLSSSSAAAEINIGTANAQAVAIGNASETGLTDIKGGSGISIDSGQANLTAIGGVITLTGNAASTLSTTSGALILTSAAAATWSVATASNGNGGNLTIKAGDGAFGSNDGGSLVLQGGAATGAGAGGNVIVKSPTDSATAFSIQNSASATLFVADTANMIVTVAGTGSSNALFTLNDSHIASRQTASPTISSPGNCGTGASAAVMAGSTDTAGSFTITTGTGGTATSCDVSITFAHPYGSAPKSILVVGNMNAASAQRQIYVPTVTQTNFMTSFAASAGGANNTAYTFNYWVVE